MQNVTYPIVVSNNIIMSNFFRKLFQNEKNRKSELKTIALNETDYTQKLGSAIDDYIESERVYIPHTTKQAQRNFRSDTYSFDLIKRISNCTFLILEIKLTKDLIKFDSYHRGQHEFNILLRDSGIPIDYCYNTKSDYHFNNYSYTLDNSNTSKPHLVCDENGYITYSKDHQSLRELLDKLTSDESENESDTIAALFSEKVTNSIRQFNIRFLFIAYDKSLRKVITLNSEEIVLIHNVISKYIKSNSIDLDFKNSTNQQLKNYLKDNSLIIQEAIVEFENYKSQEIKKGKTRKKITTKNKSATKFKNNSQDQGMSM